MASAKITMEPPGFSDNGLCDNDPVPKPHWFTSSERAHCRTVVGCFACVVEEINTHAVHRTDSWETNGAFS